jgi:aspartate 1-decarboxylase
MLKCKIHRATVTDAVLHYEGSVTIDKTLMDAAGLAEYEQVHIWNVDNGNRFTTYAIQGEADSGVICLNGAAARQVSKGDLVIIANFTAYDEKELATYRPTLVYVDAKNRITAVKRQVESESRRPRVAAAV